jgi:hypothetical protein
VIAAAVSVAGLVGMIVLRLHWRGVAERMRQDINLLARDFDARSGAIERRLALGPDPVEQVHVELSSDDVVLLEAQRRLEQRQRGLGIRPRGRFVKAADIARGVLEDARKRAGGAR